MFAREAKEKRMMVVVSITRVHSLSLLLFFEEEEEEKEKS